MKQKIKNRKGFTLVEIMIVVIIVGMLAAIAVPAFQRARLRAQSTAIQGNLRVVMASSQQCMMETGTTSVSYGQLVRDGYMREISKVAQEDYNLLDGGGGTHDGFIYDTSTRIIILKGDGTAITHPPEAATS